MTTLPAGWRAAHAAASRIALPAVGATTDGPTDRPLASARTHAPAVPDSVPGFWFSVVFIAAHIGLALAMRSYAQLATVHALAVFGIGLYSAVSGRTERVSVVVAYLAGAEVLWRITGAQVNWEFGKYAAALIMLVAVIRQGRFRPPPLSAVLYFALLLPSTFLVLSNRSWDAARDQISFNLSGPFALMMSAWFFSTQRISPELLRRMFLGNIAAALGIAAIAASSTFAGSDIVFYDSSNFAASAGFGPNQVSGALGFGAMLGLFFALDHLAGRRVRLVMIGAVIWLATQSALTFSRGGLYMAGGGILVAAVLAMRDVRFRSRLIPMAIVLFVVANYFVLPYLDAFTDGAIGIRFEDTRLTGRDRLIQADIDLWKANPLLGVGPGEGRLQRGAFFVGSDGAVSAVQNRSVAAHTEFSRLLSEHGTFGLMALLIFVGVAVANVRRARDDQSRAIVGGLVSWSALFMFSYAMRILAPSFAFGAGFATFLVEGEDTEPADTALPEAQTGYRRLVDGHPFAPQSRGSPLMSVPAPLTVLLVGTHLSAEGASRSISEELAARLPVTGCDVVTTSSRTGRLARLADMVSTAWRERKRYRIAQVDVFSGAAFFWAEATCATLRAAGKPYILTLHGGNLPPFARRHPARVRRLLRSAAAVTTPSGYLLREMRTDQPDITFIANGIDVHRYQPRAAGPVAPRLIWLRAFHEVYNPALAVRMLALLVPRFSDVHLTMVGPDKGDGSLQETQRLAQTLGIADHVTFRDYVPKPEVPRTLVGADIFLNTTNVDSAPVTVVEAMACGLCVVTTNVGGIPHLLDDGSEGLLVPPNDPEAMAAAVMRLLDDQAFAATLARNARRRAEEHDWSPIVASWRSLLTATAERAA